MAQQTPKIKAQDRPKLGSKYAARLRRSGMMPAVIYGHKQDPDHVALHTEQLVTHLQHGTHLLEVELDGGKTQTCLIKEVQYDYLGTDVVHVDLTRVDLTEQVTVAIPITIKGADASPGLKESGAFLEQPVTDLHIRCQVNAIPEQIIADISQLQVGDVLTVESVELPAGVEAEDSPDTAIASVHITKIEEEVVEEVEVETGTEPEIITERRPEDEGAAPTEQES